MFPRRAARFYSTHTRGWLRGRRAAPVPGSFNLSPFSGAMPLPTRRIASLFRAPSPPRAVFVHRASSTRLRAPVFSPPTLARSAASPFAPSPFGPIPAEAGSSRPRARARREPPPGPRPRTSGLFAAL